MSELNSIFVKKYVKGRDVFIGHNSREKLTKQMRIDYGIGQKHWWENEKYLVTQNIEDPRCLSRGNVRIRTQYKFITDGISTPFFTHMIPSMRPDHFLDAADLHDDAYDPDSKGVHKLYVCYCDNINEIVGINDERWKEVNITKSEADTLLKISVRAEGGNIMQAMIRYLGVKNHIAKRAWKKSNAKLY